MRKINGQSSNKISSGSFGDVYEGIDLETSESVAIKIEKDDHEEIKSIDRET